MKLNIGAGHEKMEGWKSLDINPASGADFIDDMTELTTIADGSCDEILSCHSLEHLYHFQVYPTLYLWMMKLRRGGKITLYLPDPRKFWMLFLRGEMEVHRLLAVTYGVQTEINPWEVHKTCFWPETLRQLMGEIGFIQITDIRPRYDTEFGMTALRPHGFEVPNEAQTAGYQGKRLCHST
jgi:hypothetical protein